MDGATLIVYFQPAVIANFDSRAAKFFVSFAFMLATIGNQIAAGSYPFSNDVTGIAPKVSRMALISYQKRFLTCPVCQHLQRHSFHLHLLRCVYSLEYH